MNEDTLKLHYLLGYLKQAVASERALDINEINRLVVATKNAPTAMAIPDHMKGVPDVPQKHRG